jgi:hypothetical protein
MPYLVRVKTGGAFEEELSVVLKPGAWVKAKSFTVTVVEIEEPKYIETRSK